MAPRLGLTSSLGVTGFSLQMANYAVEAKELAKTYYDWRRRPSVALGGVSLQVEPGTIFGLLGRNGAGKTTLVKILLSLVRQDGGEARLLGVTARASKVRRRVGYLPEQVRFPEYMKGPAFLRYMGALNGVEGSALKQRVPELLEQMDLAGDTKKLLKGYSKGMQQRLGLAQALINDPELIFLDEPTEGLDPIGRKQIRDLLASLKAKGKTIFLNSHLLSEVELICDRVAILEKGKVVRMGSPKELMQATGAYRITVGTATEAAKRALAEKAVAADWSGQSAHFTPKDRAHLNAVIDALRAAGVEIESVEPMKSTLEESFIQVVTSAEGH